MLLAGAEPEELATAIAATLRRALAIAFGANVTICLVALGVGAIVAPLPFGRRVLRYGLFGLPVGATAVGVVWNGRLGRGEGAVLVLLYVGYVAAIWVAEHQPPVLGELGELAQAAEYLPRNLAAASARSSPSFFGRTRGDGDRRHPAR